jgi:acyl dehydratase
MTQAQYRTESGPTQTDRLAAILQERAGRWVSMTRIGRDIGAWAVHSRIADVRRRYGYTIINRQRKIGGVRHSFYKYLPIQSDPVI